MSYYFGTTIEASFDDAVDKVREALKQEGFGILTDIDVKAALKEKLGVDFHNYRILGACNPPYAYKALQAENKIGAMLPCNVVVQEKEKGRIEIAAVDPVSSMLAVKNEALKEIAEQIQEKLKTVIESL